MLSLKPEVREFFRPHFHSLPDGGWLFCYGQAFESLTGKSHLIPSTKEMWLAGGQMANMVTDLYVSYSAADLICFANFDILSFLQLSGQRAYTALGLLPTRWQVDVLKRRFPGACWHTLFGDGLLGSIADTRIAAWLKGHDARFHFIAGVIIVKYRGKTFEFKDAGFSLSRFERITGLRAGVRTHKPPAGFASFLTYHLSIKYDP